MSYMYKAFISYSNLDINLVSEIVTQFKQFGIDTYVADYQPQSGDLLSEKIDHAISESDCIIVLIKSCRF